MNELIYYLWVILEDKSLSMDDQIRYIPQYICSKFVEHLAYVNQSFIAS